MENPPSVTAGGFSPTPERDRMKFHQPARRPVQTFTAAFDGECETCDGAIYEGDEIGYLPGDNRPSCEECVEEHNEGIEE